MPSPTSGSPTLFISSSKDPDVNALLGEDRWLFRDITYSFAEAGSHFSTGRFDGYGPMSAGGEPWDDDFSGLTTSDRAAFSQALAAWSTVANINFVRVNESATSVGDIRAAYTFQYSQILSEAWAYFPSDDPAAGDIWFNAYGSSAYNLWTPGSNEFHTALHEIGHAIGLKHPFSSFPTTSTRDSLSYTVMSYSAVLGDDQSTLSFYPTTPMSLDIKALQHIYGARSANTGNTTHSFDDSTPYHQTILDTSGTDTIRYEGARPASINLNELSGSTIGTPVYAYSNEREIQISNVWLADDVVIENATGGSGDDVLTGNVASNLLMGRGGNDVIDGGAGLDLATFSGVRSAYTITHTGAGVTVSGIGDGSDTLFGVERLQFSDLGVAIDVAGTAGQAFRLYQAALGRAPDAAGFGYQMRALDNGMSLTQMAKNFIASPEFAHTYGALDNTAFVARLYQNVLHREGDAAGLSYHVGNLGRGVLRENVLASFSESPENQAALIGVMRDGMTYTDGISR